MRSADIAARCREIALRVDASGEWGELAETLREAAAEVERLRMVIPNASEANAMLVAAQHIEAYLGRPGDQSILLRDLCKRVRAIQ
jgi:hypothetical protein